jgi:predicted transcriptional regulator
VGEKVKTSISLSRETREKLRKVAKQLDRSRSYVIEKFIEETFGESTNAGREIVSVIRGSRRPDAAPEQSDKQNEGRSHRSHGQPKAKKKPGRASLVDSQQIFAEQSKQETPA